MIFGYSQKVEADNNREVAIMARIQAEQNAQEAQKQAAMANEQIMLAKEQKALAEENAKKALEALDKCKGK